MNPAMRRVVVEAQAAASAGWSDAAVATLAASTQTLFCDDTELARLLALPPSDHGFREEVFATSPEFHASVFALAAGETIPLHDHPALDVISKVLRGRIQVRTWEWSDPSRLIAVERGELKIGAHDSALVLRNAPGTLHAITALEDTAFLDLFSPYYDEVARPCSYYEVSASQGDSASPRQLRVIPWDEAHP
jgi:hypothetical protein